MAAHPNFAATPNLLLTPHQRNSLMVICQGNTDGTDADLDQVMERIVRKTSKNSFQFMVRNFVNNGWIEKSGLEPRRGRLRVVLKATQAGRDLVGYQPAAAMVEGVASDPEV